jgi:hypothetical protein
LSVEIKSAGSASKEICMDDRFQTSGATLSAFLLNSTQPHFYDVDRETVNVATFHRLNVIVCNVGSIAENMHQTAARRCLRMSLLKLDFVILPTQPDRLLPKVAEEH